MLRTVKHVSAAHALTGLVLSQSALAVRSSDSLPPPGAKVYAQGRMDSRVGTVDGDAGHLGWTGAFIGLVIVGGVVGILVSKHEHKSPG